MKYLTFSLAAGAGLAVTIVCSRPDFQKSRRLPSGRQPRSATTGVRKHRKTSVLWLYLYIH